MSELAAPVRYNLAMVSDKKEKKESAKPEKPEAEDDDKESCGSDLKPVRPKIGESPTNLKQREEWFQKRSGTKKS